MSIKNHTNLTPLLLAIYNSHFFVVHYLLSNEQIINDVESIEDLLRLL